MCRPEMTVRMLPLETAEFAKTILLKEISVPPREIMARIAVSESHIPIRCPIRE